MSFSQTPSLSSSLVSRSLPLHALQVRSPPPLWQKRPTTPFRFPQQKSFYTRRGQVFSTGPRVKAPPLKTSFLPPCTKGQTKKSPISRPPTSSSAFLSYWFLQEGADFLASKVFPFSHWLKTLRGHSFCFGSALGQYPSPNPLLPSPFTIPTFSDPVYSPPPTPRQPSVLSEAFFCPLCTPFLADLHPLFFAIARGYPCPVSFLWSCAA